VPRLLGLLRAQRDPRWRVVNLARSSALAGDVLAEQLPLLEAIPAPQLVTCAVGANDLLRTRPSRLPADLRAVVGRLPAGAVVATLPQGLRASRARAVNAVLVAAAADRHLAVADVWARTGPPWQHKFAADHFHPNDLGYGDWLAAFAEAVGLDPAG